MKMSAMTGHRKWAEIKMKPKYINVVDVEATCWENESRSNAYEPRNEIIEVGITQVDIKTKTVGKKRSIIVHPKRTEISPFCTELTTLTPEYVAENGVTFERMLTILNEEYSSSKNVWASFGDYDKDIFKRNCRQNGLNYPFSNYHLNIKSLFSAKTGVFLGAKRACEHMGVVFSGTHHRGDDDSYNIAQLLVKLL